MGIRRGSISTPIIADGLVFNFDAANRASYPRTGTTATDTVNNAAGTLDGSIFVNENNGIIDFDGTDDLISFNDSDLYSFGDGSIDSPFTVETWVNFDSIPGSGFTGLVSKDSGGSSREWALLVNNHHNYFRVFIKNAGGNNQQSIDATNVTIGTSTWYCVVTTYDGRGGSSAYQGLKLYINGVEGTVGNVFNQGYTAMSNTNAPLRIASYAGSNFFNGKTANTQIYNRALSANEVLHNYNALKSRFE
jgi:hypothetical protein